MATTIKTTISIDHKIFMAAEETADELGLSRSSLYTKAIEEYVHNHKPEIITARLKQAYDDNEDDGLPADIQKAGFDLLEQAEW